MIYPDKFDDKTGFSGIRRMLAELCVCSLGREYAEGISFLTGYDAIELRLRQTDEFRRILLFGDEFPLGHIADATPWLKKLRIEGTFMEVDQLFELKRSLDTARGMTGYFKGKNAESYPSLKELSDIAPVPPFVRDRLAALLTKEGRIKDNASAELQSIRREIGHKQAAVSKKMQAVMKSARAEGLVDADTAVSIRNGRPVIPVSVSLKRRIKGFVHDESASGKTAYIEPAGVVEMNNEIRELEYAERREILRILKEFAGSLRPYLYELLAVFRYMGLVDFIRAKALLAVKLGAVKPVFGEGPAMKWKNALHPLLYLALKREKRETVPLDIELDDENRILLISGPNAGGKSVCLQTVGLLQYMLQCGMLVPMSENSETGIFEGIFIDIGDEQSLENDLSTYSSHLLNMKIFIRESGPGTLILIDEFGTGTEPMLGGAIAEAILEQLNQNRTYGVITTHYTNLKHFAASAEGIVNGAMLFDTGRMEPLFILETGKPGSSFAFEVARKIGLPEEILQSAAGKVGEDHIQFDRHLKDIIRDKHYWDRKRKSIRQIEKKLEQDLERYSAKLESAEKERKEVIARAREEARMLLDTVNRRIENTIREIRENQAEKERTREARKKLEGLSDEVESPFGAGQDAEKKLEQLRAKQERLRKKKEKADKGDAAIAARKDEVEKEDSKIRKGDMVRLYGRDITGEVLDVSGKSIMVAFGNMITTVRESRLEKLGSSEAEKLQMSQAGTGSVYGFNLRDKKLNFKAERDVRGMRGDEAMDVISHFIDDALMVGAREVKILHGKGNGILRQIIRDYLATVPQVKSFRDEHVELGGAGITVVELEN
jgi:DNA mismatch repair protein MutS2